MDSRRRVEWQNLPAELVSLIADRSDRRRLRAVCSSWRSSLPLPNKPRTLLSVEIPLPSFLQNQLRDVSLTLSERNIYCLEPLANNDADDETESRTWMVKLEEASSGTVWFCSTLSCQDIHAAESQFPALVNLFESRVLLVGKDYNLKTCNDRHLLHGKVVVSDDGDAMLCALGKHRELMLFKLNHETWTPINKGRAEYFGYSDFIHHKHKFYIIYHTGKVTVVDNLLNVEDFVSPVRVENRRPICLAWLFVQSDGDLFVLRKSYVQNVGGFLAYFDVYRLDSDQKVWAKVTDIGDQSFFIGDGCSFAIRGEQFSGCGKNLVYCADNALEDDDDNGVPGNDVSIFDLKDKSSHMLSLSRRYSRLFWPIPSWLKPKCKVSKATIGALRSPVIHALPLEGKVAVSDDGDAMLCSFRGHRGLMYFKLGDENWTAIEGGKALDAVCFLDIIYHKGKFYSIFYSGTVLVIDS